MAKSKKYSERDSQEDLAKLELLLIGLEIPAEESFRKRIVAENNVINKANLIWLNKNLSISNKHNVKLIETLKLIQRILKKLNNV